MPEFKFHRFLRNKDGAISIMAALSLAILLGLAAIVIDGGALYFARRNLQSANDAAALAAVQNPSDAAAVAQDVFTRNGFTDVTAVTTTGTYTPDEQRSVSDRFVASSSNVNAVRVHAVRSQRTFFGSVFGLADLSSVATQSTAARVPTLSFGAGTRLASLNAGVINSLLGQLGGGGISLSAVDYDSLLDTNIDALTFLNFLSTDIGVSGNYQQLAGSNVTIGQLLNAMIETAGTTGAATGAVGGALPALKSLQRALAGGPPFLLSSVIDLSPLNGRTIGNIGEFSSGGAQFNVMSIMSASARTMASGQLVNLGTALKVPVAGTSVVTKLAVGTQMAQIADGKVGSTINTAQIRMTLAVTPLNASFGLGPLASVPITIPIYIEAASGRAELIALPCTRGGTLAEIAASSGAASIQFGTVSDAALSDFSTPVTPTAVPIASVTVVGITLLAINISGGATVASSGPTMLPFSQANIDAGTVKSVPDSALTPFTALGSTMTLSLAVGNVPLISLTTQLGNIISLLDAPVSALLTTLGLQLGIIDVTAFDASCRTPVIVG